MVDKKQITDQITTDNPFPFALISDRGGLIKKFPTLKEAVDAYAIHLKQCNGYNMYLVQILHQQPKT